MVLLLLLLLSVCGTRSLTSGRRSSKTAGFLSRMVNPSTSAVALPIKMYTQRDKNTQHDNRIAFVIEFVWFMMFVSASKRSLLNAKPRLVSNRPRLCVCVVSKNEGR